MLFNLPRNPFTRVQQAAVLEWARKIGAPNVPTLESLDECERRIERRQERVRGNNSAEANCKDKISFLPADFTEVQWYSKVRIKRIAFLGSVIVGRLAGGLIQ